MYVKRKKAPPQSVTPAAALCRTKFFFGNLALTMIGVWLGA